LRRDAFVRACAEQVPPHLNELLQHSFREVRNPSWPNAIVHGIGTSTPLRHLLVLRCLGINTEIFFQTVRKLASMTLNTRNTTGTGSEPTVHHRPPKGKGGRPRGSKQKTSINWKERDRVLALMLPQAKQDIISRQGNPSLITRSKLAVQLGFRALLHSIHKLPRTKRALDRETETREDFAIRRVRWLTKQVCRADSDPPISEATLARLRSERPFSKSLLARLYIEQAWLKHSEMAKSISALQKELDSVEMPKSTSRTSKRAA
jgi:hypothetical protein